jgi:hypothetical protein
MKIISNFFFFFLTANEIHERQQMTISQKICFDFKMTKHNMNYKLQLKYERPIDS